MVFVGFAGIRRAAQSLGPAAFVAIVAVAFDVMKWLWAAPLWVDEEMIALNIRDRGFEELPGRLWLGQGAPFGWLVVQRIILLALGPSELSLRFLPLLFGIATLAAAAWVGRRWMERYSAVLFVLLCAMGQWMSHFRFELKHYSADALFALLLPAMAAWAIAEPDTERAKTRWVRWWLVAALVQWFGLAALLVTPACALLLVIAIFVRHGSRAALHFALVGIIWAASFAAHYVLSLQYTSNNPYLRSYWAEHLAPSGLGAFDRIGWVVAQLDALASDPGGTTRTVALWACAVCGFIFTRHRVLAAMFASVPLMAFLLGAIRLVPLSARLALWIVPALYLGIALLVDSCLRQALPAWRMRQWPRLAACAIAVAGAVYVSSDIVVRGAGSRYLAHRPHSNRGVDDRRAVAWLMARHRPGDVIISTRLGWPAIWWYADIPIRRPIPGGHMRDGSVMFDVSQERVRAGCRQRIRASLEKYQRILVYVGFRDMPEPFFDRLLTELSFFGPVVEQGQFAGLGRTVVIERYPPGKMAGPDPPSDPEEEARLTQCVEIHTARRW